MGHAVGSLLIPIMLAAAFLDTLPPGATAPITLTPLDAEAASGAAPVPECLVAFTPDDGPSWVGRFVSPERSRGRRLLAPWPGDAGDLLVVADGYGYRVSPRTRTARALPGTAYTAGWTTPDGALLVLAHQGIELEAWDAAGKRWETPRISWDGLERVRLTATRMTGRAYHAPSGDWRPFSVDLASGRVLEAPYPAHLDADWGSA